MTRGGNDKHSCQVTTGTEMAPEEIRHRIVVECNDDEALSQSPAEDIRIVARERQVDEVSHPLDVDGLGG